MIMRRPSYPAYEGDDEYINRLVASLNEEGTTRSLDFDILKLNHVPWLDVRKYGAKGDGSTDDTKAIQAAITECNSNGGGTVLLPVGVYVISAALEMASGVVLQGQGWVNATTQNTTEIKLAASSNDNMIEFGTSVAVSGLRNIYLNGNKDNNSGTLYGVKFIDRTSSVPGNFLDNVRVQYVNGYGLYLGDNNGGCYLRDIKVLYSDLDGIYASNVADWRFERVQSGWNQQNGIKLVGDGGSSLSAIRMYDPDFHHNGQGGGAENTLNGMYIYGKVVSVQVFGGMIDNNEGNGIYFVGDATDGVPNRDTFIGLNFLANGQKTTNTYSQIKSYSVASSGVAGANHMKFLGCNVWNLESTVPKYGIEDISDTASVGNVVTGCELGTSAAYGTGYMSDQVYVHWFIDNATASADDIPVLPSTYPAVYKNASYTALRSDTYICVDTNGGNITITLPALTGVPLGKTYVFQKIDAANSMIIDGDGSETINGAATKTVTNQWEALMVWEFGSEWRAVTLAAA